MSEESQLGRRVVFFGASALGVATLDAWPEFYPKVLYFVDNDSKKIGSSKFSLKVHPPQALLEEDKAKLLIIVTSSYYKEISVQLESLGFIEDEHFISAGSVGSHWLLQEATPRAQELPTVLVLPVSWFGLDYSRFQALCLGSGMRCVLAPTTSRPGKDAASLFTRETFQELRVLGVPVFSACEYDLAVYLRISVEKINFDNELHWNATTEFMQECIGRIRQAAKVFDMVQPSVVLIHQGHTTLASVYRYLSILRGVRVVALENSMNSTRLIWDDIAGVAVNRIPARNYYWRYGDLVEIAKARAHVQWYLSSIKSLKKADHQSPESGKVALEEVSGKTVLFIANVLTDASVMYHSRVGSQIDAIKSVAKWALRNGHRFVLKIHPRERPGHCLPYEGLTIAALREDREFMADIAGHKLCLIDETNRFDTYQLISASALCVTVCSQAGLEALLMGKEVVLLGDAYYGGLGFTHEVFSVSQIEPVLCNAESSALALERSESIARFFYVFDKLYSVEKSEQGVLGLVSPNGRLQQLI